MHELTQQRLKELFKYDPETGVFTRRISRGGIKAGTIAGCRHSQGYLVIGIDRRLYLAHRLAWLYIHGRWPREQIDHINRVRDDNRLSNLREATPAQNIQNVKKPLGAYWYEDRKKWSSGIMVHGKKKHLGYFDTVEEAHDAYTRARAELHPYSHVGGIKSCQE